MKTETKTAACLLCDDTGWKPVGEGAERRVTRCQCRLRARGSSLLEAAKIPRRYEHCDFDNFQTEFPDLSVSDHEYKSLHSARFVAGRFVDEHLPGQGLLFVGGTGTGKTHLAVAVVRKLVRGASYQTARHIAHDVQQMGSVQEVKGYLIERYRDLGLIQLVEMYR